VAVEGRMALEEVCVVSVERRVTGQLSMGTQESASYQLGSI